MEPSKNPKPRSHPQPVSFISDFFPTLRNSTGVCKRLGCLPCCGNKMLDRSNLKKKERLCGQVWYTVDYGREAMAGRIWSGWLYHISSQEAERNEAKAPLTFSSLCSLWNLIPKKDAMNTQNVFAHLSLLRTCTMVCVNGYSKFYEVKNQD